MTTRREKTKLEELLQQLKEELCLLTKSSLTNHQLEEEMLVEGVMVTLRVKGVQILSLYQLVALFQA